jgi:hypothetical protein
MPCRAQSRNIVYQSEGERSGWCHMAARGLAGDSLYYMSEQVGNRGGRGGGGAASCTFLGVDRGLN